MKLMIRIIGTLLAIVKLSTASDLIAEDLYLSSNIEEEVKNISLNKLLDFKKIAVAIEDKFDKAKFHYIIAWNWPSEERTGWKIQPQRREIPKRYNKLWI